MPFHYSPKVSIIIPCYNVEKYLKRCLLSIVKQTLKEIEIILVDDGSTDNTSMLCDEWAKKDSRIKVIHKQNEGLGYARNSGLNLAQGEYIAFVDSDDYVDINMYEQLYNSSERGKYDAIFCGLRQEIAPQSYIQVQDFDNITIFKEEQMSRLALSFLHKTELTPYSRLFMSVWHGIYKRELIETLHLRFYSEREILSEDLPFQITFFKNSRNILFIPNCLYTYCLNTSSLSHDIKLSKFDTAKNLRHLLYTLIPDDDEDNYLIDIEYYGRIRGLLTLLISSNKFKWKEKYEFIKKLCKDDVWKELKIKNAYKVYSRKYMRQYELLKENKPFNLILFTIFDKYINKKQIKELLNHLYN